MLGAGVAGLVTAVTALRAGLSVAVYERGPRDFSASAGYKAGGMLAPFCEADGAEADVVDLGLRSMALWPTLHDGVVIRGSLVVAPPRDAAGLARFGRLTEGHEPADAARIGDLEPDLAGRFRSGLFFPGEGHLDPRQTLGALRDQLEAAGVAVRFDWRGDPDAIAAGRIVDARGLGARDRFADLRGVKGEMVVIRSRDVAISRPVRLLHHRHPLYLVPRGEGVYMIGATTVESDVGEAVTVRSAGELLTQAYALHPAFGEAEIIEFNAGLRPAFPGNEPRIVEDGRVIAVNGLYRHGWLIAPALAEDIVARIVGAAPASKKHEVFHADPA
ncbi:FAD-dependent oxidoreductase [Methylobrevis albus]|uniref:FAD-dependent oxidoreductase n=1 Tax=Methylobrevis albus TaxID=2793297 RepID=UPI002E2B9636|nr:FAD-dependent oxidoreductase [Methylobrevis albus]